MIPGYYTLSFEHDTWVLSNDKFMPTLTLELRIKYGYYTDTPFYKQTVKDVCQYQFVVLTEMGDRFRVVTNDEWKEQIEHIRENDGDDAVHEWVQSSVWTCPDIDCTWGDALREFQAMVTRWESMLQLGLFTPVTNMTPFGAIS